MSQTNQNKKLNIAFTGGGTGGHVLPIESLIEYAKNNEAISNRCRRIYWFGEKDSMESRHASQLNKVVFMTILSGKMRRYWNLVSSIQNIVDFGRVAVGFFQSYWLLWKYNIDVVFCKGGYVALPVCWAAKARKIKIVLHESDMHAGLTNRLVAKIAATKFTGFPGVFKHGRVVGQILSGRLLDHEEVVFEGIDMTKTIVLVIGGAQGANEIFKMLPNLAEKFSDRLQFIVLTGTKNQRRKELLADTSGVWTCGFLSQQQMSYVMSLCDISLSRGSVTSLQEQELFGIKKIIIPLPYTGGNHQEHNADYFVKEYGDYKVNQNRDILKNTIQAISKLVGYKKENKEVNTEKLFDAHRQIWNELVE